MTILWFRRDLRIHDNAILALKEYAVMPIFIFDENILSNLAKNDVRVSFIFKQVLNLKSSLKEQGLDLAIFYGKPKKVFEYLRIYGATNVKAVQDYDRYSLQRDKDVGQILDFEAVNNIYLLKFNSFFNQNKTPYKVFTPFYKKALFGLKSFDAPKPIFNNLVKFDYSALICVQDDIVLKKALDIVNIGFAPNALSQNILDVQTLLDTFELKVNSYAERRDFLSEDVTSHFGVHLRFGTISAREIIMIFQNETLTKQLCWRDFFAYILYHYPQSETENFLDIKIDWENDEQKFEAWKNGLTGVPIIDAAMRELNETGFMHNRARMIVASFLTKDLHIDWRLGERYFAEKLLDYDCASNVGSWQWCASTGVDAQPYFRIFNPYLQAIKFDANANYIKKFVPELCGVENKILFSQDALFKSDIKNYPKPIVRHKIEAEKSIEIFKKAKGS